MVQGFRIRVALLAMVILMVPAAADEMAITDAFLEQFDLEAVLDPETRFSMVVDRCQRTGGPEQTTTAPQGGGGAANNALMFHHVEWHGERGRFLEPVFTWSDSDTYGIDFLEFHAEMVRTYEEWRAANDHPPLLRWDPMTPIPDAFAYPVSLPCLARDTDDPRIPLPTYLTAAGGDDTSPFWGYTALCDIPDGNQLGKTIEGSQYHATVHDAVGGDMEESGLTLRDPVFWAWHAYVQQIYETWQACTTIAADDGAPTAASPGMGVLGSAVLLGVAARRRRRLRQP